MKAFICKSCGKESKTIYRIDRATVSTETMMLGGEHNIEADVSCTEIESIIGFEGYQCPECGEFEENLEALFEIAWQW